MKTYAFRRDYSEYGGQPPLSVPELVCQSCLKVYGREEIVVDRPQAMSHEAWHYKSLPDADFRGWVDIETAISLMLWADRKIFA